MFWSYIHILDLLLWAFMTISVAYITFYALVSLFSRKGIKTVDVPESPESTFLVLFPAYSEDRVIVGSIKKFLFQNYPQDKYHVAVISDHQQESTERLLSDLPVTVLRPVFDKSSKAKALQFAISEVSGQYDYVVVLDADNIVETDFLHRLNILLKEGYKAVQCHRCAKNSDSSVSVLDGVSEEINNTLFRKAHNLIGLSSALIGSGMCFDYSWFSSHVTKLTTAGEDRELEVFLLREGIYIKYADDILVFDEKVSNADNFQRQRQRWMSAQVNCFLSMLRHLPEAFVRLNVNYVDKTVQQMLVPRSMLLLFLLFMSLVMSAAAPWWSIKWWSLLVLTGLSLFLAIPARLRTKSVFSKVGTLLRLSIKMARNVRHIDHKNEDFIHTDHK
ncbi:MAG: glycosyltransferase family 2 protein [Prevotella sp.]|nr:glycosyltransferase family 2 protein [Prevotella sp.]